MNDERNICMYGMIEKDFSTDFIRVYLCYFIHCPMFFDFFIIKYPFATQYLVLPHSTDVTATFSNIYMWNWAALVSYVLIYIIVYRWRRWPSSKDKLNDIDEVSAYNLFSSWGNIFTLQLHASCSHDGLVINSAYWIKSLTLYTL